jgi:hypothetical protein
VLLHPFLLLTQPLTKPPSGPLIGQLTAKTRNRTILQRRGLSLILVAFTSLWLIEPALLILTNSTEKLDPLLQQLSQYLAQLKPWLDCLRPMVTAIISLGLRSHLHRSRSSLGRNCHRQATHQAVYNGEPLPLPVGVQTRAHSLMVEQTVTRFQTHQ